MPAWLTVIGIGEDGYAGLGPAARTALEQAEIIIGGARHLAMLPALAAETEGWSSPIQASIDRLNTRRGQRIAVLASGDPLFFGIGATLARQIPAEEMRVIPHPGAFAYAASRLVWPLQQVQCLTLHARPLARLARYLAPGARLLALSESGATPWDVAAFLTARGWGGSEFSVLERLGGPAERILHGTAQEPPPGPFDPLNVVALRLQPDPGTQIWPRCPGLPDDAFQHDGQLTKSEIRAQTLAALAPLPGQCLWDIGAGCGSIGIEWLRALEDGQALAIEAQPARCALIRANALALGVPELQLIQGLAPAALEGLPRPDAVFIGGGLDQAVLERAWAALVPGGRLVANMVTLEAEQAALGFHQKCGGRFTRIAVQRALPLGQHLAWRALAPVTQFFAIKGRDQG